jgi:hypothetical protein
MIASTAWLAGSLVVAQSVAPAPPVTHPGVPCWSGDRSWTAPGEAQSEIVVYDTGDDIEPYLITHNRDQIRRGAGLEQDYNFIDYWFGDPGNPIRARYYLRRDESVAVDLPGDAATRLSLEEIRARFPADVLCYLQSRFDRIEVHVADGYQELWALPR